MKTIALEKIKISVVQSLSPHLLGVAVDFREDFVTENITMMVTGYIWGEKAGKKTICYPADWWQAIKLRWLPARAIARWPVRYAVHDLTPVTLYPKFRVSLPKEPHVLKVDVRERSEEACV